MLQFTDPGDEKGFLLNLYSQFYFYNYPLDSVLYICRDYRLKVNSDRTYVLKKPGIPM